MRGKPYSLCVFVFVSFLEMDFFSSYECSEICKSPWAEIWTVILIDTWEMAKSILLKRPRIVSNPTGSILETKN